MPKASLLSAPNERILWVDTLRGVTITLVVFFHAILVYRGGIGEIPTTDRIADAMVWISEVLRTVRMPAFFFCSGLVFTVAYARGWGWFVQRRVRFAVWVILVWSLISFGVEMAGLHLHPHKPTPYIPAFQLFWVPYSVLWFLYAILIVSTLAMALRHLPDLQRMLVVIGLMAFCDWLNKSYQLPSGLHLLLGGLARSALPFFMLGVWYGPQLVGLMERRKTAVVLQMGGLVLAGALILILPRGMERNLLVCLPATVSFIASIRLLTIWQTGADRLAKLGRCSLEVFLLHPFMLAIGVALLQNFDPFGRFNGAAAMGLLMLGGMGVFGSFVLGKVLRHMGGDFLFDAPRVRRNREPLARESHA